MCHAARLGRAPEGTRRDAEGASDNPCGPEGREFESRRARQNPSSDGLIGCSVGPSSCPQEGSWSRSGHDRGRWLVARSLRSAPALGVIPRKWRDVDLAGDEFPVGAMELDYPLERVGVVADTIRLDGPRVRSPASEPPATDHHPRVRLADEVPLVRSTGQKPGMGGRPTRFSDVLLHDIPSTKRQPRLPRGHPTEDLKLSRA